MATRRKYLSLALAAALAPALGGCFRPLYGTADVAGLDMQKALAEVHVEVSGERLAHYVKSEIEYQLTGGNVSPGPKRFKLQIVAAETLAAIIVDRSGTADAATHTAYATYTLTETGRPTPVTTGTAHSSASYERSGQRFATVRAARDAQIRNARLLAEQIRARLAIALAERRAGG
jgi:LPS-assembly lipoprotein